MSRTKLNNTFSDPNVVTGQAETGGGSHFTMNSVCNSKLLKASNQDNDDGNGIASFGRSVAGSIDPGMNFISGHGDKPKPIFSNCDASLNCKLPKCFCAGRSDSLCEFYHSCSNSLLSLIIIDSCIFFSLPLTVPFTTGQTPQMIVLTFDDAVNDVNFPLYEEIFHDSSRKRLNPNGCPIKGTFFVSHEWTDYGAVQTLYSRGHEIASHSIT